MKSIAVVTLSVAVVVSSTGCDAPLQLTPSGVARVGSIPPDAREHRSSAGNVTRPMQPSEPMVVELTGASGASLEFETVAGGSASILPRAVLSKGEEELTLPVEPGDPPVDAAGGWRRLRATLPRGPIGSYELRIEADAAVSRPRIVGEVSGLPRWNILWIVLDTVRADYLGCYGGPSGISPNIDAMASRGVLFERALSQASWTLPAMVSMLTGLYAETHGVVHTEHRLSDSAVTFVERLAASGVTTGAIVSGTFTDSHWNLDQGFDHYDDLGMVIDDAEAGGGDPTDLEAMHADAHRRVTSPLVTDRAVDWLETQAGRRFFLLAHYFDPHQDYLEHADPGKGVDPLPCVSPALCRSDPDPPETARLRATHAGEIAFTDRHIGRLIDHLVSRDLLQDTVVLITADHGEEFYERNYLGHGNTLFNELIRVPLLIVAPDDTTPAGRRVSTPVGTLDIGPTLLELVGVRETAPGQGRSLVPLLRQDGALSDRPVFCSLYPSLAPAPGRRGERLAYRVDRKEHSLVDDTRLPSLLYDWSTDEPQARNLAADQPHRVDSLAAEYRAAEPGFAAETLVGEELDMTRELREKLRALGYASGEN